MKLYGPNKPTPAKDLVAASIAGMFAWHMNRQSRDQNKRRLFKCEIAGTFEMSQ